MNILFNGRCDPWGFRHTQVFSQEKESIGNDSNDDVSDFIVVSHEANPASVPEINLLQPKPTTYGTWGMPNLSRQVVTQGMYEEVFLGSSSHCISGEKESAFWQFMHTYFTAHGNLGKEAFQEILQASYWASSLESALLEQDPTIKFATLANNIAKCIESMDVCKGCIVPSGPFVTLRIHRATPCKNSGYELELFSRNKLLLGSEIASLGGRDKLAYQHFTGLPLSQVTNQHWLYLLLQAASAASSSAEIYNQFLAPLRGYLSVKKYRKYHISKDGLCRIQNLWDLFGERLGLINSRENLIVRKLELQLEVLLGYFYRLQSTLTYDSTAFVYLKEGLQKTSRGVLAAFNQGFLSNGNLGNINTELHLIDEKLKSVEKKAFQCQPPLCIKGSNFPVPISLPNLHLPIEIASQSHPVSDPLSSTKDTSFKIAPYPHAMSRVTYFFNEQIKAELDSKTYLEEIHYLIEFLQDSKIPIHLREQKTVDILFALPLDPDNPQNLWSQLSPELRIQASTLLTKVSHQITSLINQTSSLLPDRLLALVKATAVVDYLARLNESATKLTKYRLNGDLYELILDLLRGSAYSTESGFAIKRSYLANSTYKVRSPLEYRVLMELKNYCHWHLPKEFEHHFTKDLDSNIEFSEWRGPFSKQCSFGKFDCTDILVDLTLPPYRNDPQCQNLHAMQKNLRQVLKIEDNQNINLSEWLNCWGRPINHPIFQALAYAFKVEKGELSAFNQRSNSYTPEAIMEDPWIAAERAYESWQRDLGSDHPYKKITFEQAKAVPLNYFSDNDLKSLLLACTKRSCLRSLLGAIKQNVLMLSNRAIQGFIEHLILQPGLLKRAIKNDIALQKGGYLNTFFEEHIDQLERLQEIPIALFMVQLCRRIDRAWPKEVSIPFLPSFKTNLLRWLESSSQPNSPLLPYRYAIITELLGTYGSGTFILHHELKDFILLKSVWDATPIECHFDPVDRDYIERLYHHLQPTIQSVLDNPRHIDLKAHILDRIAVSKGFPCGKWEGLYPYYTNGTWRINIAKGQICNTGSTATSSLPSNILRHPHFIEAFPFFAQSPSQCETTKLGLVIYYSFIDSYGIKNLIEEKEGVLAIYKASTHTGFSWSQYIPTPIEDPHYQQPLIRQNRLYFSQKTNKAYFFSIHGHPEFVVELACPLEQNKLTIGSLRNISDQRNIPSDFSATLYDPKIYPELNPLLALGNASEILLWNLNGVLKEVEFYNGDAPSLVFAVHEGQFYGKTKGLLGYVVDFSASSIHGIPLGLILSPKDKSISHSRWLLPHFSGNYVLDKYKPAFYEQVYSLFKSYWNQQGTSVEWANSDHCQWHFEEDRKIEFWTLDISLPSCCLQDPDPSQNYKQYFDLLKYCLLTIQNRGPTSAPMAKECLKKLSSVASHKIASKDLEVFIREIYLLAEPSYQGRQNQKARSEVLCLVLHCFLILHPKSSLSHRAAIEKQMVQLIPKYFAIGSQIDSVVKLLDSEEKACLLLMQKYRPAWFQKHAPLIVEPSTSGIVKHLKQKKVQFVRTFHSKPLHLYHDHVKKFLYNEGTSTHSDHSPESILPAFRQIYRIAGGGAEEQKASPFIEMFYRIKKSSALYLQEQADPEKERARLGGQEKKVSKSSISISTRNGADDLDLLLEYVEAIFEIKILKPNLPLPPLPNRENQIKSFCQALTAWVNEHYLAASDSFKTPIQSDITSNVVKIIIADLLNEKKTSVLMSMPLEELEKKLKGYSPQLNPQIKLQVQESGALVTEQELAACFKKIQIECSFPSLKLDQLKQQSNRKLLNAVKKLEDEIALLKSEPRWRYSIVNLDGLKKILIDLKNQALGKLNECIEQRDKIEKMLTHSSLSALECFENRAGLNHPVTFDEVVTAYLQNDFTYISQKLRSSIWLETLKQRLSFYFKAEVQRKYTLYVCGEIEELLANENLSKFHSSTEDLYALLTRRRCFNSEDNPQLLAMEYLLGFMIRPDQLQMVIDFLEKPNGIRRAATGEGKTSVIIPLIGLLKANGSNLVTLKFLNSQFNKNCEDIFKLLGTACKKKILALLYTSDMPLAYEQQVNGKKTTISLFQKFYEELLQVIINKGCVITDKKTEPLLKAKMIEIYDRLSVLPQEDIPEIDLEHLHWLGKLFCLFNEREETLIDEFDKFLFPFEEFHFLINQGKPLPRFIIETALDLYDLLLQDSTLDLPKNSQAELPPDKKQEILSKAAEAIAQQWISQKKMPATEFRIAKYLQGTLSIEEESQFLHELHDHLLASDRDRLSLQKDLISKFLRGALFKAADHTYIRSEKDGKSIIPCEYADKPKEGSEFEDVRIKLCYMIQYYYQRGISFSHFEQWVNGLKAQAVESLVSKEAETYSQTVGERNFKEYFPDYSLESLTPKLIKELYENFQKKMNSSLIRKFLTAAAQELKLPGRKISLTPHNEVSIAKATSGTSATKGCLEGLHRRFDIQEHLQLEQKRASTARMLLRMLERINPFEPVIYFDQSNPQEIIEKILATDPSIKVVIDGAGALRGMGPSQPAQQLLQRNQKISGAIYFDSRGFLQTIGQDTGKKGIVFSHEQSRGANVKIPLNFKAVLLANGRTPQEEVNQNEGRLRRQDQKMRIALPKGSPCKDLGDLINAQIKIEAEENSVKLLLSKQQEMQDIVHAEMTLQLAQYASIRQFLKGFEIFNKFKKHNLLVSEFEEDWSIPGEYFAKHGKIERPANDTVELLKQTKEHFLDIANKCALAKKTIETLSACDPESYRNLLPDIDISTIGDREIQIENEMHTEVISELILDINKTARKPKAPFFLPWMWNSNKYEIPNDVSYKTLHPAYDDSLVYSSNFLPLGRNDRAPQIHHRQPHDLRQHRLHYISVANHTTKALDPLDAENCLKNPYNYIYDTKTHRFLSEDPNRYIQEKKILQLNRLAQMRFEDGQYSGYPLEEWEALTEWIKQNPDPQGLECYFRDEILKNRPNDRERYLFSKLRSLFQSLEVKRP